MSKIVCGLDCEVNDPLLKVSGYSWKYNEGYILNTALYFEEEDRLEVIAGTHNKNCPFCEEDRIFQNRKIIGLLMNPDVILVGANIIYDLGWLLYEYGLSTYDVQCSFIDVLQAESILDEFGMHSLESVSWKYLKYGKTKDRIEDWVKEHISAKGDFRQHLKDAPWELLEEYVKGDAKNPVKVWRKQLTLLKEQDLVKRCKLEFDCILPSLQMTMYGLPIDVEQKKKNLAFLTEAIEKLHKEFLDKYKLPNFRVTATRDIASFCDMRNIPYNHKITLTGMNGVKFRNGEETDHAYNKAKQIVASFCLVKGKPTAYVPKELAERTADLLTENGFMFNNSPNVDKKFFESKREAFPEIGLIADWKLAVGIQSKILGEKYDRFLTKNFNGEDCIKPQFKITDTISFRYSSNMPNGQQVPSKGGFTLHEGDKETEISFPKITRALFKASKGCVFGKIDYGQIEYRLICNIACGKSGEEVREQYRKNPHLDFHQYVVDLTGLSRKYAKNMSFGCFSKDSLWLTNTGWVRYNKVTEENVLDCNGFKQKNKNFVFKDKGFKFTLSNGVQFTVNKEHLFFDCEKTERHKCTKKASEMKVGDRVPVTLLCTEGVRTMSKCYAYLAGLYVGDGCGCKSSVELLAHCENADYVAQCLAESNFSFSSRKEGKVVRFCVHKEASAFFRAFGTRTGNKHIIDSIFRGTREIRLSFLAGLLDSDGTVRTDSIRFMGTNEKLLREVALLCSTLGFDCGFNVCDRSNDGKSTEYTLLVYNTNGEVIPSVFRKSYFRQAKTDVRGWKLDRQGEILKEKRANCKLYKEEPQLYEYLIRDKRNCFVHNSFMPSDCWQRAFLPAEIVNIEEVEEADFVYLNTSSGEYNAMGIATHNCAFGMGLPSMAKNFGWTMEHAEEIAEAYHSKMPFVAPTLALVGDVAKERGYIKTVYGSHARLHDKKKAYTMLNRYTQGSGGECLKCSIVQAYKEGVWRTLKVANTVHDELNMPYLEPTEEKMIALYRMAEIMRTSIPTLKIPLEASPELGDNWASTKEIPAWIESRDSNDEDWQIASDELKKAVNICERLLLEKRVNIQ